MSGDDLVHVDIDNIGLKEFCSYTQNYTLMARAKREHKLYVLLRTFLNFDKLKNNVQIQRSVSDLDSK